MKNAIDEMRRHMHTAESIVGTANGDDVMAAIRVAEKERLLADTYAQIAMAEALTSISVLLDGLTVLGLDGLPYALRTTGHSNE